MKGKIRKEQLARCFLALSFGVEQQCLRTGYLLDEDWDPIVTVLGRLSELGIRIDDTSGIALAQRWSRARRWIAEHDIQLLIVDCLQLVTTGDNREYENYQQEVASLSHGLRNLACELNVPVQALAQLLCAPEMRQSKVLQLLDLRESGSREMDADVVLFMYRDEVYNKTTERRNQADLSVAKQRNGRWVKLFSLLTRRILETAAHPASGGLPL